MSDPKYHPSFAPRVRDQCYLGATDREIADLLGVSVGLLKKWREEIPEFAYAWKDGAAHADAKVVASLFKRACGYDYDGWKETKDGRFEERVHVPPNVQACIFWLTNKRPTAWTNVPTQQLLPTGSIIPLDSMSEIEIARRIAYALANATHALIEGEHRSIEDGSVRPLPPQTK